MKKFLLSLSLVSSLCATVDISHLDQCVDDVKRALAMQDRVMYFTTDYNQLMDRLRSSEVQNAFPQIYQQTVLNPFVTYLERLGAWGFSSVFAGQGNPQTEFLRAILPDVAEALLQNGEQFAVKATNAFQEVISDLYDGFLGEQARISNTTGMPIKPPDRGVLPGIVKWGNPDAGPYTWPVDATAEIGVGAAIVSLPPAHRNGGLLAWTALPHETAGHNILHADTGLLEELGNKVYAGVLAGVRDPFLANYWKQCIDETASDVLGILNTGPTTGMGLIGYFRGLVGGSLRNVGYLPPSDTHPIDVLRGFLAASVVSRCSFSGAKEWSDVIRAETRKDLGTLYLVDPRTRRYHLLSQQNAIRSADIVAHVILNSKLSTLEGHSLLEIQDWTNEDQQKVDRLAQLLSAGQELTDEFKNSGYDAAHVVAAATQEAFRGAAPVQTLFDRMVVFLDVMHQYNTVWNMAPGSPTNACVCKDCQCPCCVRCQAEATKTKHIVHQQDPLLTESL
jgi:hypothetical protein